MMKRFIVAASLLLFVIVAMAFGGVFGGISSSNDAEFAPVSVSMMVLPECKAIISSTGDVEVADPVTAMVLYGHEAPADVTYLVGEVEITTTAELTALMEYIASSEFNIVVMISPVLRSQTRLYRRLENKQESEVRSDHPMIAIMDGTYTADTIGLTNRYLQ